MSQTTPTIITTTLPSMTPFAFLNQLPLAHDLPDDSECPICVQQYGPGKAAAAPGLVESLFSMVVRREPEAIETERAVRLPCQHVLGWRCVRRWIHPKRGNQNTCPYCVQQLFTPLKYPVSNHPYWSMLIELLGRHGFTLDERGFCIWDQAKGATALSRRDLLDAQTLVRRHAVVLEQFLPKQSTLFKIQRVAAARSTVQLREVVLYLQLQSNGVSLPEIELQNNGVDISAREEAELGYPFMTLGKRQEDALFAEFEKRKLFDSSRRCHRRAWESDRGLGWIPWMNWATDRYFWVFP
ncbi:hypothetical protein IMSHALPRED_005124 [Imshaugia aleurites]|uniref:RING-type domain-containing protein n=1 Tax=Imshaugia aleurites TaxID=172621 RepID=A0A8H3FB19_9LECA|nr:hypothetical protein IMSHALPRED_005124 [Imshaugia aleurites]